MEHENTCSSTKSLKMDPGVSLLECMFKYKITDPIGQSIGKGSYGNVYKGVWKNEEIALKMDKNHVCYALEYMEYDLKKFMKNHPEKMTPERIKLFMRHLLSAINYCHEDKIMHRDLKPDNLLVDREGTLLKLADFGQARPCPDSREKYTGTIQTMGYKAPEVLLGSTDYSYEIDMWSVGCILAEMVSGTVLFKRDNADDIGNQLNSVYSVLGTPDEKTWPGLASLPGFAKTEMMIYEPQDISKTFPDLDRDGLDLLWVTDPFIFGSAHFDPLRVHIDPNPLTSGRVGVEPSFRFDGLSSLWDKLKTMSKIKSSGNLSREVFQGPTSYHQVDSYA